jgi:hypothetical protein
MANQAMTPAEKYERGAKFKKAGIIVAIIGGIIAGIGGGLFWHGHNLQMQALAEAKANGWGELTITDASGLVISGPVFEANGRPVLKDGKILRCPADHPRCMTKAPSAPAPTTPLGGGAGGKGDGR